MVACCANGQLPRWDLHDVPFDAFKKRWPNFSPREIACRGTGRVALDFKALDNLQALRTKLGAPMVLNSAYRSPEHNKRVGGSKNSLHLQGRAFDCRMDNHDPNAYIAAARSVGFTGFGTYPRQNFTHVDTGRARSWGRPYPKTASGLPSDPPVAAQSVFTDPASLGAGATGLGGAAALTPIMRSLGELDATAQLVGVGGLVVIGFGVAFILFRRARQIYK